MLFFSTSSPLLQLVLNNLTYLVIKKLSMTSEIIPVAFITRLLVGQRQENHDLIDASKEFVPFEGFFQHRVKFLVEFPDGFEVLLVPIFCCCNESVEIWRCGPYLL
jgi:hypothetical protein